jgi:hypothetical protein
MSGIPAQSCQRTYFGWWLSFGTKRGNGKSRIKVERGIFAVSNMPRRSTEPTRFVRAIYLVAIGTIALGWLVLIAWIVFKLI